MWSVVRYFIGGILIIIGVVLLRETAEISFGSWQMWLSWFVIFIGYNIGFKP